LTTNSIWTSPWWWTVSFTIKKYCKIQLRELTRAHQTTNVIFTETFEDVAFYLSKVIGYQQSIIVSSIQVDKVIAWANKMKEWRRVKNRQGEQRESWLICSLLFYGYYIPATVKKHKNYRKTIPRARIFEKAVAEAWSEINLKIQNLIFSGEQLESPSEELNRACGASPPKLWHSL